MKCRLKIYFSIVFIVVTLLYSASAYSQGRTDVTNRFPDLDALSFVEMLNSVELGKNSELVQKFQAKEGNNKLLNGKFGPKSGCTVESYRNKEVLVVTIPAELLFAPNSTELKPSASDYLLPIRKYLREPDMYRVLLAMHTDNTGSESYRDQLTLDRVESVFNWFEDSNADTRYLFDYAMSDDIPLLPNTSMENRAKNRRLEVYLVPGKKMLEQAKKGRIAF